MEDFIDWFTFFILVISTCFLLTYGTLLIYYIRYPPLKGKSVANLICIILSGVIHMWSVFIVNEHVDPFIQIHFINCIFWTFLMQFCIGLGFWFSSVYYRIHKYGKIFRTNRSRRLNAVLVSDVIISIGLIPILAITAMIWIDKGCYYDPMLQTCKTKIFWEVTALLWLVSNGIIFSLSLWRLMKSVDNNFFNERKALFSIAILGFLITIVDAFILFTGKMETDFGRNIYTLSVCALHLFCPLRLSIYTLSKAIKNDTYYSESYKRSLQPFLPVKDLSKSTSYKKLLDIEIYYLNYLSYCMLSTLDKYKEAKEDVKICNVVLTPKVVSNICECIQNIDIYRRRWNMNGIETRGKMVDKIIETYLLPKGTDSNSTIDSKVINVPYEIKVIALRKQTSNKQDCLDDLFFYLNEELAVHFFDTFMKDVFPKTASEELRKTEIVEELNQGGLLDNSEKMTILNNHNMSNVI